MSLSNQDGFINFMRDSHGPPKLDKQVKFFEEFLIVGVT